MFKRESGRAATGPSPSRCRSASSHRCRKRRTRLHGRSVRASFRAMGTTSQCRAMTIHSRGRRTPRSAPGTFVRHVRYPVPRKALRTDVEHSVNLIVVRLGARNTGHAVDFIVGERRAIVEAVADAHLKGVYASFSNDGASVVAIRLHYRVEQDRLRRRRRYRYPIPLHGSSLGMCSRKILALAPRAHGRTQVSPHVSPQSRHGSRYFIIRPHPPPLGSPSIG